MSFSWINTQCKTPYETKNGTDPRISTRWSPFCFVRKLAIPAMILTPSIAKPHKKTFPDILYNWQRSALWSGSVRVTVGLALPNVLITTAIYGRKLMPQAQYPSRIKPPEVTLYVLVHANVTHGFQIKFCQAQKWKICGVLLNNGCLSMQELLLLRLLRWWEHAIVSHQPWEYLYC